MGALLVLPHLTFGQDTTRVVLDSLKMRNPTCMPVKNIDEVHVAMQLIEIRRARQLNPGLDKETIETLSPDDVGDLVSKLSGTSVKAYGGLGGLKSISIRAMGSQHTATVVDGFNVSNSQSGQMNLAQIQADGLTGVVTTNDLTSGNINLPVSAVLASSSLSLFTFQNGFGVNKNQLRANIKYGSFNRQEGFVSGVYSKKKKVIFSGYGKYRRADGDYNYQFLNGLTTIDGVRQNNDYEDTYFGGQLKFNGKEGSHFRLGYRGAVIDQGLPGAVILYSETADERLTTIDNSVYGDAYWHKNDWYYRVYSTVNRNNLNYEDPSFLNAQGFQSTNYLNQSANVGFVVNHWNYQKINLKGGIEETVSSLVSSDSSLSNPFRSHTNAYAAADKEWGIFNIKLQLGGQFIAESTRANGQSNELFRINPAVEVVTRERRNWHYRHSLWYKNTFRMPSFNELYYNYVGNSDLKPETAHQFNYGLNFIPKESNRRDIYVRMNAYFNRVENKIVAIPTKNLFVWSTQNVTNVHVFGADAAMDLKWNFGEVDILVMANYSYQKAIDVTEGSLNRGDQIAYTPEHMSNLDVGIKRGNFGFRIANNFVGSRFALNENVDQNLVKAYLTTDLIVNYTFELKKENSIKLQANVKNVFDQSYAYVRSFVLPGRNFLISLSYALH